MSAKNAPLNTTQMVGLYDAEFFDVVSSHIEDTFRIFVGKPASIAPKKKYPAVYTLDGNASFASMMGTQRMLTQGAEVPPSFVFAIGYPGETLAAAMTNRNRDYAPTQPGEAEAMALGGATPAGGPAFFKFIQEELKPLLAQIYPVDIDRSTLQGTSLGGLFAAWVLLTQPTAFEKYILCSPAIWWREEQFRQWEEAYAASHDDLAATVFIGAGTLEVNEHLRTDALAIARKNPPMRPMIAALVAFSDEHGWPEVAKLTPEFAQRLQARNYPSLKIHCHNMPDENHMSASASINVRGLRFVNGSWEPNP